MALTSYTDTQKGDHSKVAVVTGASSGIGAAIARELSEQGHPVLAVARRAERLQALATEAQRLKHAPIYPLAVDLTAEGASETIASAAEARGGCDWLVNNAGIMTVGTVDRSTPREQAAMVALNCTAMVELTTLLLRGMRAAGRGTILNIASMAGLQATPYFTTYSACKAFDINFSEGLSAELRGTGVNVTVVCPGPVTTEIFDLGLPGVARRQRVHEYSPEKMAKAAIAAARRKRVFVVVGLINRIMAFTMRCIPRPLVRRAARFVIFPYLGYSRKSVLRGQGQGSA
jgi:uncharacterized protein